MLVSSYFRMRNSHGFSLVEAVIAGGLLAVLSLVIVQVLTAQTNLTDFQNKKDILRIVLEDNAYDLESRTVSQIPAIGECLVRTYDISGKWQSDATVASTATECQEPVPTSAGAKVLWIVSGKDNISVTFNPSTHLKLKQYNSDLRKIRILGGIRNQGTSESYKLSFTVFK